MNISQFIRTWNSFRLISLVFRIIWSVSTYFLRAIILELIYKLILAISNSIKKTKTHTETYIYPNRHKRSYSFVFQTWLWIRYHNTKHTNCKNGWNKILEGFVLFFLFVSGIRDGPDKWSRELWSKGRGGVISSGQEFLERFFFFLQASSGI